MHALRQFLAWTFAFTSLVCLRIAVTGIPGLVHRHHDHYQLSLFRTLLVVLVGPVLFMAQAGVFGAAWWTIWREQRSARVWGIVASLVYILFPFSFVLLIVFYSHSISVSELLSNLQHTWLLLAIGIAGLVAFGRRFDQTGSATRTHETLSIPGDGTSSFVNKAMGFLLFGGSYAAYWWWLHWVHTRGVPTGHISSPGILIASLIGLAIVIVHEFGHTATALALGMTLRAFIFGPFQWHVQDGNWKFQLKPKEILSGGGATSAVPATADFSRETQLCVLAAGPLITLVTGTIAMWAAFRAESNALTPIKGYCALFGAWSLIGGVTNLIPLRTARNYSDGAQIYQLLSGGPWGDFQLVSAVVGSSLVTSLRPRDFDIYSIQRTAQGISQGWQGLILRLYAYIYFLDQGRLADAAEALRDAESIYPQSSSKIPPELHTDFVFGNAYVRRDAVAAREWWTRLEASKPTRFNSDYWRAYSSLQWIEGNLKEANEAWEKSNALSQRLPNAGAYEFDRYCCSLLRKVLDESAAAIPVSASKSH